MAKHEALSKHVLKYSNWSHSSFIRVRVVARVIKYLQGSFLDSFVKRAKSFYSATVILSPESEESLLCIYLLKTDSMPELRLTIPPIPSDHIKSVILSKPLNIDTKDINYGLMLLLRSY
jgi:hypothetical protein